MRSRALAVEKNHYAWRHSVRACEFNVLMRALSVNVLAVKSGFRRRSSKPIYQASGRHDPGVVDHRLCDTAESEGFLLLSETFFGLDHLALGPRDLGVGLHLTLAGKRLLQIIHKAHHPSYAAATREHRGLAMPVRTRRHAL